MNKLKKILGMFFIFSSMTFASWNIDDIKSIELERNFKHNLMTISTIDDLIGALIMESGELGALKSIKKQAKWSIRSKFGDNVLYLVKYKNSKVTVPVVSFVENIIVDVDNIECIGIDVMGNNKYVYPRDIGY